MNKLLFILMWLGIYYSVNAQTTESGGTITIPTTQITKEGALEIVEKLFPEPGNNFWSYTSPELIPGYWYFMVDPQPWVKQDHSYWFVRVPADAFKAMTEEPLITAMPSIYNLPSYDYVPEKTYNPPVIPAVGTPTICSNDFKDGVYQLADMDASHTYAIILSGGIAPINNNPHYWNDCSFMYRTLRLKYHIPKEHITLLMADGDDPGLDQNYTPERRLKSSNTDLDGDGKKDLELAATKKNLINSIKKLYKKLGPDDHLFLFVSDHGISKDGVGNICLWNGELIDANELTDLLRPLANAGVTLSAVMGQCYSGKFRQPLNSIGCVILTASEEGSHFHPDIMYDTFLYAFTCAVAGHDHTGKILNDFPKEYFKLNFYDAFQYAFLKVKKLLWDKKEEPHYASTPKSLIKDLSFDCVPKHHHLRIKDNSNDDGLEPNRYVSRYWESPDIWVRNNNDNKTIHENPIFSSTHPECYVNVKVLNDGREANPSESQWLQLYWADASTVITEKTWRGLETDANGNPKGGPIGNAVPIPPIQPNTFHTVTIPWNISSLGSAASTAFGKTFCILASITPTPIGDNFEVGKTKLDAWKFKRQAQKNITIVEKNGLTASKTVNIRNHNGGSSYYTLSLEAENPEDESLFENAFVDMKVSRIAYENWEACGSWLESCSEVEEELEDDYKVIRFDTADSKISAINLDEDDCVPVSVSFTFHSEPSDLEMYNVRLIQRDEDGNIVGGETFQIQPPTFRYEPIPIEPPLIGLDNITLTAHTEEYDQVVWYNSKGMKESTNATMLTNIPSSPTSYKVIGRNEDGEFGIGSIVVDIKRGIESVAYNAGTGEISGKLYNPSGTSAFITITPIETVEQPRTYKLDEALTDFTLTKLNLTAGSYLISYSEQDVVFNTVKINISE